MTSGAPRRMEPLSTVTPTLPTHVAPAGQLPGLLERSIVAGMTGCSTVRDGRRAAAPSRSSSRGSIDDTGGPGHEGHTASNALIVQPLEHRVRIGCCLDVEGGDVRPGRYKSIDFFQRLNNHQTDVDDEPLAQRGENRWADSHLRAEHASMRPMWTSSTSAPASRSRSSARWRRSALTMPTLSAACRSAGEGPSRGSTHPVGTSIPKARDDVRTQYSAFLRLSKWGEGVCRHCSWVGGISLQLGLGRICEGNRAQLRQRAQLRSPCREPDG